MNRESVILTIRNMKDIEKLNKSTVKYINIDIKNINMDVIKYLKDNGSNFLYSECIDNINGYIYVDYDTFFESEEIISNLISNIPSGLNELEKAKYLYIYIGKMLSYDINSIPEKNEVFNFVNINTINNIWGSIKNLKASNQSYCKLYMYLCSLIGIKCDIISVNNRGFLCNKLNIDGKSLIVNLTEDVPFIETGFKTRFFSDYNDNMDIDRKILYVNEGYSELELDKFLGKLSQEDDNFIYDFLVTCQKVINIDNVSPIELGIIFDYLFSKYCSNIDIKINNLYLNDIYNNRKHFILISYNDNYYCYNYNRKTFVNISEKDLVENIENDKIGIYMNEDIPLIYKYKEVV